MCDGGRGVVEPWGEREVGWGAGKLLGRGTALIFVI